MNRAELVLNGALILGEHILRNRSWQVLVSDVSSVEIRHCRCRRFPRVEGKVERLLFLKELPLLLRGRNGPSRTHSNPRASTEAHRKTTCWLNDDDGNFASIQRPLLNNHRWNRENQSVVAKLGQLQQQLIVDCKASATAIVLDADVQDTR